MPTTAEQRAYARKMREIMKRFGSLEEETVKKQTALLREIRARVAAEILTGGSEFDAYRVRQLQTNIDRMIAQYETDMARDMARAVDGAYELGGRSVTDPFNAVGFTAVFYAPSRAQVNVLTDFSADLIKGITSDMLSKINQELRFSGLGGRTPYETMKVIDKIIGAQPGKKIAGVSLKAERITRTELMRTYNMAAASQREQSAKLLPGMMKRWIHSGNRVNPRQEHIEMHYKTFKNPIPYDEPYHFSDGDLMQPQDPAGPASQTIYCGCTDETVWPDIGVFETPRDKAVLAEMGEEE